MTFGAKLKMTLKLCGMTQQELARLTYFSATTVHNYAAGKSKPTADVAVAFARALGMPDEYFDDVDEFRKAAQ